MTIFWPADLPQFVGTGGYGESLPDITEEFRPDIGPPKTRKRMTKAWRAMQAQIQVTREQAEIFKAFIRDDLYGGLLPFGWVNPRTQGAAFFRIRKPMPVLNYSAGEAVSIRMNLWQTDILAAFRADSTLLDASSTTATADEANTW